MSFNLQAAIYNLLPPPAIAGVDKEMYMSHPTHAGIRERVEADERERLSPLAAFSDAAVRDRPEAESPVRTSFQRDRDRILHSKPFRRLKHKTQVFIAPLGDHYRTRLTHTLEVTQIARTEIGRAHV